MLLILNLSWKAHLWLQHHGTTSPPSYQEACKCKAWHGIFNGVWCIKRQTLFPLSCKDERNSLGMTLSQTNIIYLDGFNGSHKMTSFSTIRRQPHKYTLNLSNGKVEDKSEIPFPCHCGEVELGKIQNTFSKSSWRGWGKTRISGFGLLCFYLPPDQQLVNVIGLSIIVIMTWWWWWWW